MASRIFYYSTNQSLSHLSEHVSFKKALLMGQAPDLGLFMPDRIPSVSIEELRRLPEMSYPEIAAVILGKYLHGDIPPAQLSQLTSDAYSFDIPIEKIREDRFLLRLDQGPTASFKDFAAQMLARLMGVFKDPSVHLNVLVATSGDTGGAIGRAFHGIPGIDVYILYPKQEVSPEQEAQLTSINENVFAVAVDGKFDNCQSMVKTAFEDSELDRFHLTSGNSINIGRLLPQIVYYFYAYSRIVPPGGKVIFSIPSGNFGNAMGCELARQMGLPVETIIIATNENDAFPKFLRSGTYKKLAHSRKCLSNSMNVGHPSNLARLFDLYGGHVDKDGRVYRIPDLRKMRESIFSVSISDAETVTTMRRLLRQDKILLEPHGAVAYAGLENYEQQHGERKITKIVLETAHPGKFAGVIRDYLGFEPEIPPSLKGNSLKNKYAVLPNNYDIFKNYLLENLKK